MSDLSPYLPVNNAPLIEDFIESVTLKPGENQQVLLGKPFDSDKFYLAKWEIAEGIIIDWIILNNSTGTSPDFIFSPPLESAGTSFTLTFVMADHNVRPASKNYYVTIVVEGEIKFVPSFETEKEKGVEIKPVVAGKKIKVKIGAPNHEGLL